MLQSVEVDPYLLFGDQDFGVRGFKGHLAPLVAYYFVDCWGCESVREAILEGCKKALGLRAQCLI